MEVSGLVFGALPIAVQLFQSSLVLYSIYSECQDLGKASTKYETLLRIERYRYEKLGAYIGLGEGRLKTKLKPAHLDLIVDILAHIAAILLESRKLEKKYFPNIKPETNSSPGPKTADDLIVSRRLESHAKLAKETQERASIISTIKFAVLDKSKFKQHIEDLRDFNDGLERIGGYQTQLESQLVVQMLDAQSVQTLSALGTVTETLYPTLSEMAKRKAAYLEIRDRQRQHAYGSPGDSSQISRSLELKLSYSEIRLQKEIHSSGRMFGTYKGISVMVEWKILSDEIPKDQSLSRIQDMARFLSKNNPNQDDKFSHLLGCLGYFTKPGQTDRVALVYQTSDSSHTTLRGMLEETDNENFNLGARLRLALSLAECVFYLHLTGWLHKGIRSSNIIVSGDTSLGTKSLQAYLAGFDAARLDGATEISEKVDIDALDDLYQHPNYQAANKNDSRYTRQYDIYSLGLLLLELGTWQLIQSSGDYKPKKYSPTRFLSTLLKRGPVSSLSFTMGNAYREAVIWCLKGQFETRDGGSAFASLKDSEQSTIFWDKVVLQLVKCFVEE